MVLKNIKKLDFSEITTLYSVLNDICNDYARMTDGYALASGDKLFENAPQDIKTMIEERQKFFNIRNKVKEEIKHRILFAYEQN